LADELSSEVVEVATDSSEELVKADLTVVVLVKVLENALELRWAKGVTVLLEAPLELMAVHLAVTVVVHASEDNSESSDAVHAAALQSREHFCQNLVGWLTLDSKRWIHIWIVAGAHQSEEAGKLFVVKFAVSRFVVLSEEGLKFFVLQGTSHGLKSLFELGELNCAVALEVKMLEEATGSFALVVSTVGSLTNLFKNNFF
jgi:hypothetical protein